LFLFKKIVGNLLMPLSVIVVVTVVGLALLWFFRRQKTGARLVTFGCLLLYVFSFSFIADRILLPLENDYKPLTVSEELTSIPWVVVLGGGQTSDSAFPAAMRLTSGSLSRLVEGIRIYRETIGSRLLLSGGTVFGDMPEARTMALVAEDLGVPVSDILMETASRDTKDQALNIATVVGDERFILVTTAAHMPRTMALFHKAGIKPIAAPTDFKVQQGSRISPYVFFPGSGSIDKVESALHEYLGILWAKLRGQI
jgi:uncharacterized SAM-binding protein YcdF (DUF218 family)